MNKRFVFKVPMKYIVTCIIVMLFAAGCKNVAPQDMEQTSVSATKEQFIEFNKAMVAEENDQIDALLLRYKWPVVTTETGVRYWIYEKGRGVKIETGNVLQCEYSLKLITGEEIYNSATDGQLVFKIEKSDQPSGLEEVLLLLYQGDKAKIIVPSYLAYGIAGDDDKSPSSSTLIYDIYIDKINIH
jgi:FKBP-type peptidyl-prolyl cis-trans isomerase